MSAPGKASTCQPAASANAPKAVAAAAMTDSPAAIRAELEQLKVSVETESQQFAEHSKELDSERAALKEQLQQLAALESKLGGADSASAQSGPAPESAGAQMLVAMPSRRVSQTTVPVQTPQELSNRIANLEQRAKAFGPFTFSGDIRLRDEPSFGGPAGGPLDQNRVRFRFRFFVEARLNDEFSGGFSLASGDINNPISDNQTLGDFYARKPIAIDTAFVRYSPHQFHALTLIGGKFAYPWYNTELVWDKDLRPEGAAETLAWDLKSVPALKRLALVGFELPFTQVAGISLNNKSLVTSAVYGGQLQTAWQFAHWLKFGAFTGFYNYHNADPIALALAKASAGSPQTPLTGLLPLAGNTVQNSILTTKATGIITIGGTAYPTAVTSITNAQFASNFGLFDSLATFDVATPWQRWPVKFIGDYVQNTKACANMPHLQSAPANSASVQYSQSFNYTCNSHQRRAYWGEIQVGEARKRGDWELDYTRIFIEREAVVSNFNYSEILQGSNVSEHRAEIIYEVHPNVRLSYTALIGRPLNFGGKTPPQNWLDRMQFDVIYAF
ncbi:MAG: putative porin [Acidobacteriota bacterium]|nr:putative porin [Acidobacteriota bacterium]